MAKYFLNIHLSNDLLKTDSKCVPTVGKNYPKTTLYSSNNDLLLLFTLLAIFFLLPRQEINAYTCRWEQIFLAICCLF